MNAGFIALACILGIIVCGFAGWMFWRWREARDIEAEARVAENMRRASERTNLDDAKGLIEQIDQVRAVQRELKSAFARRELDGGVKSAADHPLYVQAQEKLEELHEELMGLI